MPITHTDCLIQGQPIPSDVLGELNETRWSAESGNQMRGRLAEDGYLLLRSVIGLDDVSAARQEVFERLVEVDEIKPPAIDGIATGTSRRAELVEDLGDFWQSVSEGPRLRGVSHGTRIESVMTAIFGEPARAHDYMFLRPSVVGRATRLHYDLPFFGRGSQRVLTVWTALGDVPVCDGSLVIVEGSHRFDDLIEPIRQIDYQSKDSPQVQMMDDAVEFSRQRQTRLLTADFRAGDLIVFTMTTLHGTLDNHSSIGRARLSCDVRWQPAADPIDPRYIGPNPAGTTGAGYGELNGAKPLTEDWHTR
ncbi:MAG: phytanoyl-CoA dioxygenase family protein [Planctomycetota bacterium]|nr:phytanoyl-CoA dioxygenase family protein [Planctomycetota bacterium]